MPRDLVWYLKLTKLKEVARTPKLGAPTAWIVSPMSAPPHDEDAAYVIP